MIMIPVSSSNLLSVGYDTQGKALYINFHSGNYVYYNVPENVYEGLLNAPSKGQYHHLFIKNSYQYSKLI